MLFPKLSQCTFCKYSFHSSLSGNKDIIKFSNREPFLCRVFLKAFLLTFCGMRSSRLRATFLSSYTELNSGDELRKPLKPQYFMTACLGNVISLIRIKRNCWGNINLTFLGSVIKTLKGFSNQHFLSFVWEYLRNFIFRKSCFKRIQPTSNRIKNSFFVPLLR